MVRELDEAELDDSLPQGSDLGELEAVPTIPDALLKWLEATYRPRCLTVTESERAHMEYAGSVKLVARLRQLRDLQVANMKLGVDRDGNVEVRPPSTRTPGHRPSIPRSMR